LPADTPRALAFTVWYELGIVGAVLAAAGAWLAFRNLERAPRRLAPYMAAAFSAVVALAFLNVDFVEMTTLTLIAVAVISTDVAARSQYRTTRPSAASLAHL
jgi:O-antigen ligase